MERDMKLQHVISSLILAVSLSACQQNAQTVYKQEISAPMIVKKASPHSARVTIDRLETILKSKGLTVFTRVNHAAGAKNVGIDMADSELIIFGNPKLGTPLMLENPKMGLDLPLKALAFTDASGQTYLTYTAPATLQSRHNISENTGIIAKMTGALDAMTSAAVSEN